MRNLLLITILLFKYSCLVFSQEQPCKCSQSGDIDKYFEEKLSGKTFIYSFPGNFIQYFNEWESGDVFLTNGNTVKNQNLRYRGYGDQLIWARKSDFQMGVVDKDIVSGFVLYNKNNSPYATFKKIKIRSPYSGDSIYTYLQVLAEGTISFYAYRRISIEITSNNVFRDYLYYIYTNDQLIPVKLRRSTLIKLLSYDKATIKSILRKNHLNTKGEENMIRAIDLYNAHEGN